jgi:hypothetical protein
VLTDTCNERNFTLVAFDVRDGSALEVRDFSADLAPLSAQFVDAFALPLAFISEDVLSVRYSDYETYGLLSLEISISGGSVPESPFVPDDARDALLRGVSEYPEFAVNSPDHALAVASSETAIHVFDLRSGAEVLSVDSEQASFGAYAWVADDSATLYIANFDDPDDYDNFNAALVAYSLPDGAITAELAVSSPYLTVSPDGRYAVAQAGSSDGEEATLWVIDMTTGERSEILSTYEAPKPVARCVNRESDLSDVGFQTSGKLSVRSVNWLPDSTRFLVTRSYRGEGAGGGLPCYFDTSRLNVYSVGD